MAPLIRKTLFRMKKLNRPFTSGQVQKKQLVAKGFARIFISAATIFLVIGIVFSSRLPSRFLINEGDIASEDVYAPFDFEYSPGVDEAETKQRYDDAELSVIDIYSIDENIHKAAVKKAENFFSVLEKFHIPDTDDPQDKLNLITQLHDKLKADINKNDMEFFLDKADIAQSRKDVLAALEVIYSRPIMSQDDIKALAEAGKTEILLYDVSSRQKNALSTSKIDSKETAITRIESHLNEYNIKDKKIRLIMADIISAWIEPNLIFNKSETDIARRDARSSVLPAYIIEQRLKGEAIIRKGQRILRAHMIQLDAISRKTAAAETYFQLLGVAVVILLLLFAMYIFLKIFEPNIYSQEKLLFLVSMLIVLTAVFARIIAVSPLPGLFLPLAAVPMLLTLLTGGTVAAIVLVVAAAVAALVAGVQFNIFLVSLIGGVTAICTIYNARSRSNIIRSGLYVGMINFVVISAMGIISNFQPSVFIRQGLWGIASGITAAAATMIFLPIFESLFKLTTDIRLLELADMNHPLLKDMVTRATGTYHHSIVVANLAEAASEAIGANSLLCRIGSYYHDIGKIEKAEYFAENSQNPSDAHKGLSPSMSTLVITNHVKDGVELAVKHKLGNAIRDIIEQHHGTGIITYFYHHALESKKQNQDISEESFRYPGPKPQSKESAIVMLSDSVEAASRVLQAPTPQKLKELVRKIINNKFIDRQLNECDLTLKDISNISESFVKILSGTYHSRVEYPDIKQAKHEHNNNK
jgi:cyclic-di-AMP phosphodiesterase PgpH